MDSGATKMNPADEDPIDAAVEPPPPVISRDERRLQVRAFGYWTSLLNGRLVPNVADLPLDALPDFGASALLVDLSREEGPRLAFLGAALRAEAGLDGTGHRLAQIPPRSLVSRLTDRCHQVVACGAPIGFEAEFVNQRGRDTLYRGLLMPFSSRVDDQIDHVFGVINWKELADRHLATALDGEVGRTHPVLRTRPARPLWGEKPDSDWLRPARRQS